MIASRPASGIDPDTGLKLIRQPSCPVSISSFAEKS